jgi:predicted  nucleic acid-binding Zn-ribbon protein
MSYREYLTLEEVNANNKTTETKVTKLEKEFKNLNNTFEEQQKKMKQATAQASDAQAKLHSNIRM